MQKILPLETLNKLGQIGGVLGLHSHTHNRGHRELHHLHVVSLLAGGDGTGLHKELVNTDQAADVTGGDILDGLDFAAHHKDGSLNNLNHVKSNESYLN